MAEITFTADIDILSESDVRDMVEEHINSMDVISEFDVDALIRDAYEELEYKIDEMEVDASEWDRASSLIQNEILELRNQVEIARRSISVLLEDRERTLKQRAKRMFTLTGNVLRKLTRRVHWHMPRR